MTIIWGLPITLVIGFTLLLAWRPRLASSRLLGYFEGFSLILVAFVAVLAIYHQRNAESFARLSLFQLTALALLGVLYLAIGLYGFLGKGAFVDYTLQVAVPRVFAAQKADLATWRNWINARLPDSREQEALSRALNKMYPPARTHAVARFVFLGVGWWVLSNVLAALIEGIVQKRFLDPFL